MTSPHPVHTASAAPFSWTDPAWIGALATAVLAIFAIVTAVFAFLAYRKQKAEVTLLQDQAARDIEQRRRAQASKVFVTAGVEPAYGAGPADNVFAWNTSDQPIYTVEASYADNRALFTRGVLLPGRNHAISAGIADADGILPAITLDFTDAAGVRWRTTSNGKLMEAPRCVTYVVK